MAMKGGGMSALLAAPFVVMDARAELAEIAMDEYMSERERAEARGGAIGEAAGSIAGYAAGGAIGTAVGIKAGALAGAKLGAALGTVVPGVGNVVGLVAGGLIGAGVGWLGGRAGRAAGAAIGGASASGAEGDSPAGLAYSAGPPNAAARPYSASGLNAMRAGVSRPAVAGDARPPAYLVDRRARDEARSVMLPAAAEAPQPVAVEGEIVLRSELRIEDDGYRLRQTVGRNTTPYKFAVGSAAEARAML